MSNLEYIIKARKILESEYKLRRTAEYDTWLAAHKDSWKQPHTVVPFPPFVVSPVITPFTPSVTAPTEDDIVAKALELYNQANPQSAPVASTPVSTFPIEVPLTPIEEPAVVTADVLVEEPVVLETIIKSTELIKESTEQSVVESEVSIEQPVVPSTPDISVQSQTLTGTTPGQYPQYHVKIYKIYESMEKGNTTPSTELLTNDPTFMAIEAALNTVLQPTEELAKAEKTRGVVPSVLEKFQAMTAKWSNKEEPNV